jgi:hypothetical protein
MASIGQSSMPELLLGIVAVKSALGQIKWAGLYAYAIAM